MPPSLPYRQTWLLAVANTDPRLPPALAWIENHLHLHPETQLYVYCLDQGTTCLNSLFLNQLKSKGARVFACAKSACEHHVPVQDQATFGGLGLLTDLLLATDQFISLSPGSASPWPPPPCSAPPPQQQRLVHVTLHNPASNPGNAAEALRIATGLLAEDRLLTRTSCLHLTLHQWLEICQHHNHKPALTQSWQAFLEAGGLLLTRDSTPTPPPDHPAFAVIPF